MSTPRFGVWALVQGSWAALRHPQDPVDASWERNKALILQAERLGFDSTLVAQHTLNPNGDDAPSLEAWSASAALAALTHSIEIITAIKPYLYHPVVLAKMALQIEEISRGRFGINLVNGWFRPELEKAGIAFAEHDDRYDYGREWINVVKPLLEGRTSRFVGEHFQIDDYRLAPSDQFRPRPAIYLGGESEPARALAAHSADVYFINGQPLADVAAMIADLSARPRQGSPLRFALSAFVIARPTAEEAEQAFQQALALSALDATEKAHLRAKADPSAVMLRTTAQGAPRVGTNGGTAAGLVGSYEQVAERIQAFHAIGIETFMLQFQPFEAEMERFAEQIMPRVRQQTEAAR